MLFDEAIRRSPAGIAKREMSRHGVIRYKTANGSQYELESGGLNAVSVRKSPIEYKNWVAVYPDNDPHVEWILSDERNKSSQVVAPESVTLTSLLNMAIEKRDRLTLLADQLGEIEDWTESQIIVILEEMAKVAKELRELL